jgi:hypothetical protein
MTFYKQQFKKANFLCRLSEYRNGPVMVKFDMDTQNFLVRIHTIQINSSIYSNHLTMLKAGNIFPSVQISSVATSATQSVSYITKDRKNVNENFISSMFECDAIIFYGSKGAVVRKASRIGFVDGLSK